MLLNILTCHAIIGDTYRVSEPLYQRIENRWVESVGRISTTQFPSEWGRGENNRYRGVWIGLNDVTGAVRCEEGEVLQGSGWRCAAMLVSGTWDFWTGNYNWLGFEITIIRDRKRAIASQNNRWANKNWSKRIVRSMRQDTKHRFVLCNEHICQSGVAVAVQLIQSNALISICASYPPRVGAAQGQGKLSGGTGRNGGLTGSEYSD